jgi:hypothetical protein
MCVEMRRSRLINPQCHFHRLKGCVLPPRASLLGKLAVIPLVAHTHAYLVIEELKSKTAITLDHLQKNLRWLLGFF